MKDLRKRKGWTQQEMATAIGISLENYRKYENRSLLPHRLVPAFCLVTGITEGELYTRARKLAEKSGGKTAAA